ncbi:MAG: RNA methyltransferase [Eubacteriales bacterium]
MDKIISRSNEKIKFASLLKENANVRCDAGLFLLEGARLCSDAAASGIVLTQAFFTTEALNKYSVFVDIIAKNSPECYEITDEISCRLSDTSSPQGVFCVCKTLDKAEIGNKIDFNGKYVALENIQDPANFGAICRTAEALGLSGLIVSGGCNLYNPKALRAAMGSSLRLNIVETENLSSLLIFVFQKGMLTIASTVSSEALDINKLEAKGGVVCVIGNEGSGISKETLDACTLKVTIPMKGNAESLNASASAAIIMWELMR